jgi:DNA-binding protein HU-beta
VNRTDLVAAVANHTGRSRKDVDEVLRGFTDVVTTVVAKGEPVAISGFAKFEKVDRPARMGRNPQTGDPVKIKASKKPKVTPLKGFKDSVVKPSQAPKLTRGTFPLSDAAKSGGAAKSGTATKAAAKKSTAKKAAAKSGTAKKAATKKTTAKKASARKAGARS